MPRRKKPPLIGNPTSTSRGEIIRELKELYARAVHEKNFTAQAAALDKLAKTEALYRGDGEGSAEEELTSEAFLAELRETIVSDDVVREWVRAELEAYDAARGGPPARPVAASDGAAAQG